MTSIFLKRVKALLICGLVFCLISVNYLPACAKVLISRPPEDSLQTYELENIKLETQPSIYKQISFQEKSFPLQGSLRGKYLALQYTLQNNSPDDRIILIQHSLSGRKELKGIQDERIRLGKSLLMFPALAVESGKVSANFLKYASVELRKSNQQKKQFDDSLIWTAFWAPIATGAACIIMVGGAVCIAILVPLNLIAAPVLYPLDLHNDALSKKQLDAINFKPDGSDITLKPNETIQFVILLEREGVRPLIEVH